MRRCLRPALLALILAASLTHPGVARADVAPASGANAIADLFLGIYAAMEFVVPDVALELRDGEPGAAVSFPLALELFGSPAFNFTLAGAPQYSTLDDHWRLLGTGRATIAPFDDLPDFGFRGLQWALALEGGWSYHADRAGPLAGAGLTFGMWNQMSGVAFKPTLTLGWRRLFLDRGPVVDQVIVDVQFALSLF